MHLSNKNSTVICLSVVPARALSENEARPQVIKVLVYVQVFLFPLPCVSSSVPLDLLSFCHGNRP